MADQKKQPPKPYKDDGSGACKSGVPRDMKRADRLLRDFSGEKK